MRYRVISFIVFQIAAWISYFNWDNYAIQNDNISKKILQVVEYPISRVSNNAAEDNLYQLILRNDGFFTRIYLDQTIENGLWRINYDIPSIILKSSIGEFKYRILKNSDEFIQLELINTQKIVKDHNSINDNKNTLFSTSSLK